MALHHRKLPSLKDKHVALTNDELKEKIEDVKTSTPSKGRKPKEKENENE